MKVRRAARQRGVHVIEKPPGILKRKALRRNAASRHDGKK
jgi:hypothetical protein